ncbi:cell wall-binding repeat-containing protein [Catenulispora subtropica]|uniref:Cell wall binding repeat 2-containing protein n=1 Tax=Catenulispora subtropica TaxID=450798 RepID=A0ABN2S5C1_9ACTN
MNVFSSEPPRRRLTRLLSLALAATGVAVMADVPAAHAASGIALTRWQGPDRYGTAAALALGAYPGGAANVVVASGQSFPDALSASYLAGYLRAPILLTEGHALPDATAAALRKLGATHVYLVGGTAAADGAVEAQLRALPGVTQVTREAGPSRYDTSLAIATAPPASAVGRIDGKPTALLASGATFPDALAGSAVASGAGLPILLSDPKTLSAQAASAIRRLGITQVLVLGGPAAVSPAVENALRALGVSTQRLAGSDRGSTAAAIASYAVGTAGFDPSRVAFARGDDAGGGVDALALGVLAGVHREPLLLTDSPTLAGDATLAWLAAAGGRLTAGDVAGGPGAVSDGLLARLGTPAGGGGTPAGMMGQYAVTLSGVAGGNAFQRSAIVILHPTVTTTGTTNGVNPVDVCLLSGNPGGVPEAGAIWNGSNSACDPGATSAAIDMGFVTVDGSTVTLQPDERIAATGANVFTTEPGLGAFPYFPVSGSMTVTANADGTLTGTVDIVGYGGAFGGSARYQAQISGHKQ